MFIKAITKKNKGYDKEFTYGRLVNSYRIGQNTRHKTVLNLGKIELDKSKWKDLADRIEQILNQEGLFAHPDPMIENLANYYAALIIKENIQTSKPDADIQTPVEDFKNVDINTLQISQVRTIGAEHVCYDQYQELEVDQILKELGFKEKERKVAALLILGRMIEPGSEHATLEWAKQRSTASELLGFDLKNMSLNPLYRVSDLLHAQKDKIEKQLRDKEKKLYSLEESLFIYDLTNTYFEGQGKLHPDLKYGRSKEKRSDCPLLTLGMIVDKNGFPKKSKIFKGNISEPETLEKIITDLNPEDGQLFQPIVLIDAGIATEDNLKLIRAKGYHFVCVPRSKPIYNQETVSKKDFVLIKEDKTNQIEAKVCLENEAEKVLFCKSKLKELKEKSMSQNLNRKFEEELVCMKEALSKVRGMKKYEKVLERLGRAKERHKKVSHLYDIQVEKNEKDIVLDIKWELKKEKQSSQHGQYYIKTSRVDLNEKEIWDLYNMIRGVEDSFRSLKSDLGFRPNFHQKEERINGHIFISILAYHILNTIRYKLRKKNYAMRWSSLRKALSTHVQVTTSLKTKENEVLYIRKGSNPEPFQKEIYNLLDLKFQSLPQNILTQ